MRDLDLNARSWKRGFSYEDSNGEHVAFKAGDPIGMILRAWVEASMQFSESDRDKIEKHVEIWGQPRAWTDEKISTDLVELLREDWGQALVFCDCLGAQWTERVLLRAWMSNILWAPYAPEVTSTLQEPNTHEHWQLKTEMREVKSELHLGTRDRVVVPGEAGEGESSAKGDQVPEQLGTLRGANLAWRQVRS